MAPGSYRFACRPRWLAGHVLVLAAAAAMVLLGHWQLTVSDRKHFSLQNFGYALQWWAFSAAAAVFWLKVIRDGAGGHRSAGPQPAEPAAPRDEPVAYRRYVMPSRAATPTDPEVAAYNAYLAALADKDGLADQLPDRPAEREHQ